MGAATTPETPVDRVLACAQPGTVAHAAARYDQRRIRRRRAAELRARLAGLLEAGCDEDFLSIVISSYEDDQDELDHFLGVLERDYGIDAA